MKAYLMWTALCLSTLFSGCGTSESDPDINQDEELEEFEMVIDYYRGICERHPYQDFCLRVDRQDGQGFVTMPTCHSGAELEWGKRYTVRASLQGVDNGNLDSAPCWDEFVISEVLEVEEVDEPFTLTPYQSDFYNFSDRPLSLLGKELTFADNLEDLYILIRDLRFTKLSIDLKVDGDRLQLVDFNSITVDPEHPSQEIDHTTTELTAGGLSCGCGQEFQYDEGVYSCGDQGPLVFQQLCD